MKKAKKVLKANNLPTRLPLWSTLTTAIALDYWNAPQWVYGAVGLFFLFAWGACIYAIATEEKVDILKNDE